MTSPNPPKTVTDDPDVPTLPFGCIDSVALMSLVAAILRLERAHARVHGTLVDSPCLRRIESSDGAIVAHVSCGPAVGGSWERLIYNKHAASWQLQGK